MKESFIEEDKKEEKMNAKDVDELEKDLETFKDENDEKMSDIKADKEKFKEKLEENTNNEKSKEISEIENDGKKEENRRKKVKKDKKDIDRSKNKKKHIMLGISIGILVILGILISTIFSILNINNEKIISGVSIAGVDVSGLSREEAKGTIGSLYDAKKEKEIDIKYEEYESSLNSTLMEVNYDVDKAVEEAYSVGRKDNIFLNNYDILFTLITKKNVNVDMSLNEDATKQIIDDISVNLPGAVIDSNYSIEDDELIITKGKAGIVVETDKLKEEVKKRLNTIDLNEEIIKIPVTEKEPELIDIDKIHEEIYKEAKDAYYTKDPFTVYPEVEGVDFDVEEARTILASEEKDEYVIKLKITKPKVTIDQIGSEAFPDRLAIFTTRFDVSDVDRSTNLRIACQKINGKVVLPGETFSYNQALGARTAAAGYKNGKVYSGGEVVDGIGGGICQISSTLYNAVLFSNLEVVERRNHQFVTSYVEAGRDATVVYGLTDFKFKNTRKYPIRIVASAQNGIATVSIYGIKEGTEYTFKINTKTVVTIPFSTKYVEDSSLDVGTEKVKQKGANGLKSETYITKMLDGKVVSTTLLSRDTYDAMARIIIKGTNGATTTTQTPDVTQTTTTPVPELSVEEQQPTNPTTSENQQQETTTTEGSTTPIEEPATNIDGGEN